MSIRLLHGDCLIELPKLAAAGERFHACVTDPPYHLTSTKRGGTGIASLNPNSPAGRARIGTGFMGKAWDGGDVAFRVETWRAVFDCLLPGAHLLAFGGTRTFHRMVCAIEDAGFEIRDTVCYLYGSGFPKSHDVSKAIDKALFTTRTANPDFQIVRAWLRQKVKAKGLTYRQIDTALGNGNSHKASHYLDNSQPQLPTPVDWEIIKGMLELSATDDLDRPPRLLVETFEREIVGYRDVHKGVAFTSDGPDKLAITLPLSEGAARWQGWGTALKPAMELICVARKPLDGTVAHNVLTHGCGGLNIDGCRIEAVQGDYDHPGDATLRAVSNRVYNAALCGSEKVRKPPNEMGRFPANVLHDGSPDVLGAFAEFGTTKSSGHVRANNTALGRMNDDAWQPTRTLCAGVNDSGFAARFFYSAKADKADRADSKHPTVKPVDLIRWLVTLACPPGGHVLDCFAGSGTTGEACMLAGFDCTLIEREAQHGRDIEHRIKRWSGLDAPLFADAP